MGLISESTAHVLLAIVFVQFVLCFVAACTSLYRLLRVLPARAPELHARLGSPQVDDILFTPWPWGRGTVQKDFRRFLFERRAERELDPLVVTWKRRARISWMLWFASWLAGLVIVLLS